MSRFLIRAVIVTLACVLAGCSLLFTYGNIERYIRWSIDDYIDWDSVQKTRLRALLAAQLDWHRATQLPRYRHWLETTDRALASDIDVAQLTELSDQLHSFWQDVMAHAEADIRQQLASLSDEQVEELADVMREKQADLKSEYDDMTLAELVKDRRRKMAKTLEYWLGPLDEHQVALIATWAQELPDGRAQWLDNRQRWNDAFYQALRHRNEPEVFAAGIHRLFVTPEEGWSPEVRKLMDRNRATTLQLIVDLHNSRTPKQSEAQHKRVAQWLERLDQLAEY